MSIRVTEIAERLVRECAEALDAYHCALYLADDERTVLRLIAVFGPASKKVVEQNFQFSLGEETSSIAAEVFKQGKPLNVTDVETKHPTPYLPMFEAVGSLCSVPIMIGGVAIGVLSLARKKGEPAFQIEDAQSITHLANQFVIDARLGPKCGEAQLSVEIEVPESVTDEDFLQHVKQVSLLADDVHRSLGGRGLKVERLEVYDESLIPEGAPNG